MHVAVVIPCLNEQDHIATTVRSLGFGGPPRPPDADLILVDNGSTDLTWAVLGDLIQAGPPGRIHRIVEPVRGFVPPRHTGVRYVADLARQRGQAASKVLILQGDADTLYLPDYVARMRAAARPNTLLEGAIGRRRDSEEVLLSYRELELRVDAAIRDLEVDDDQETLVDDKACGYRLSDYEAWGGLVSEYCADGSEIHAETTRMFLRARARANAGRQRVDGAGALTSSRRIWEDPALYFSTAGFPRERSWVEGFRSRARIHDGPAVQVGASVSTANTEAIRYRIGHSLALFAILPRLVARMLDKPCPAPHVLRDVLAGFEAWTPEDMRERPGRLLTDLLEMIDAPGSPLDALVRSLTDALSPAVPGLLQTGHEPQRSKVIRRRRSK
ncbi:MAG: glycosyltransferase family A protein [Brevundimonas sp.]|uniref:glycosyltransferase family 2 protein n=1 Tax=Brevundimonas sp. TaxID=1871086 RepID=UPI00273254B0|nr:glycosyltransferase family A protein [Brevundimonas sp.]MDP3405811.1 glycosyltransferase family A protein [Brevundimonas sp.]